MLALLTLILYVGLASAPFSSPPPTPVEIGDENDVSSTDEQVIGGSGNQGSGEESEFFYPGAEGKTGKAAIIVLSFMSAYLFVLCLYKWHTMKIQQKPSLSLDMMAGASRRSNSNGGQLSPIKEGNFFSGSGKRQDSPGVSDVISDGGEVEMELLTTDDTGEADRDEESTPLQ